MARFPDGFLWGVATAAHQVEGNNVNCDSWLMEHLPGSIYREPGATRWTSTTGTRTTSR